jgi:hypothetical protein
MPEEKWNQGRRVISSFTESLNFEYKQQETNKLRYLITVIHSKYAHTLESV